MNLQRIVDSLVAENPHTKEGFEQRWRAEEQRALDLLAPHLRRGDLQFVVNRVIELIGRRQEIRSIYPDFLKLG